MSALPDAVTLAHDLRDTELEQRIREACDRLCMATTQAQAYTEFDRVRVLIAMRSEEQIERLERDRGLKK